MKKALSGLTTLALVGASVSVAPTASAYVTDSYGPYYQYSTMTNLSCAGTGLDYAVLGWGSWAFTGVRLVCLDNSQPRVGTFNNSFVFQCSTGEERFAGIAGAISYTGRKHTPSGTQWAITDFAFICSNDRTGWSHLGSGVTVHEGVENLYFSLECANKDPVTGLKTFFDGNSIFRRVAARCAE